MARVDENIAVEKNASGTTQAAYVNEGPSIYDPLVYMDRAGTKSYHLFNHLGTTLALASAAQALTDTYRRNAWGVELASTGSTSNPFGYVGAMGYYQQLDGHDLWVGLRIKQPHVVRWLTRDPQNPSRFRDGQARARRLGLFALRPIVRGYYVPDIVACLQYAFEAAHQNGYAYVFNSPLRWIDPTGEWGFNRNCVQLAARWATAREIASGLPGRHNGKADAFRHCLGSCVATYSCGQGSAAIAGLANELHRQPIGEFIMDDFNNNVGGSIGATAQGPRDCDCKCRKALDQGKLVTSPQRASRGNPGGY